MTKMPIVNVLSVIGLKSPSVFLIRSTNATYDPLSPKGTYRIFRETGHTTYESDAITEECNCLHWKNCHTYDNYLYCKHVALAKKTFIESRIKNKLHRILIEKNIKLVAILKVSPTSKGMISVSYLLSDGGRGCTFINPKTVKNTQSYFRYENSKQHTGQGKAFTILSPHDDFVAKIYFTANGYQKVDKDNTHEVSDFYFDMYSAVLHGVTNRIRHRAIWKPGEKPETSHSQLFFSDQEEINLFRKKYSIFA